MKAIYVHSKHTIIEIFFLNFNFDFWPIQPKVKFNVVLKKVGEIERFKREKRERFREICKLI